MVESAVAGTDPDQVQDVAAAGSTSASGTTVPAPPPSLVLLGFEWLCVGSPAELKWGADFLGWEEGATVQQLICLARAWNFPWPQSLTFSAL